MWRTGNRGGPSTHEQQDLYRAMLIFACAGLDILIKQLIKNKLSKLIPADKAAEDRFKEYVKRDLKKDDGSLSALVLALIDRNPREVLLREYLASMATDSLQSFEELCKVSEASGLNTKMLLDPKRCS